MSETRTRLQRLKTSLGLLCLVVSFLLWSPGVGTVRASDEPPAPTAPPPASQEAAPLAGVPARNDGQIELPPRAPDPRAEAAGGVIVLNTSGYNYATERPSFRPQGVQLPASPADEAQQ